MNSLLRQIIVLSLFLLVFLAVPTYTHASFLDFDWFRNVFSSAEQETQISQVIKITRNRPIGLDGEARGKGKKFKVKDSHYADVVLESSVTITAEIKSINNLIVLRTEATGGLVVLSLSNLPSNTTYFKYIDSLHSVEEVKTDSSGFLPFSLDMSVPRLVFLQTKKSTRFLNDDATGGNCTAIGTWTSSTKTCKLSQDLNDSIQIESDGITLDGNGHTITGSNTGNGIYVNGRTGVVIKNINITGFSNGLYVTGGSGVKIQNVNVTNSVDAVEVENHTGGLIENGTLSSSQGTLLAGGRGIELDGAINTTVTKNTLDGNEVGLRLNITAGSMVTQNTIKNNTEAGLRLVASNGETIYQNNFLSNAKQVTTALGPSNTSFDQPWPKGGNFWDDNPTCTPKTDNPNLCQEKYTVQSGFLLTTLEDNQPWVSQDKWVSPDPLPGGGAGGEGGGTTGEVPLYTQVVSPYPSEDDTRSWASEVYAFGDVEQYKCGKGGIATIRKCGCVLVSIVMIMRYHGATVGENGVDVNPFELNAWLQSNNGYSNGDVLWPVTSLFVDNQIEWIGGYDKNNLHSENFLKQKMDEYLTKMSPVIVKKVGIPGVSRSHFFVVDKKLAGTYAVKDPAWYETQNLNDTRTTANIRDYQNSIDGVRIYKSTTLRSAHNIMSFTLASPAELLITDPTGRKTGYDTTNSLQYEDIPNSGYYKDEISNPDETSDPTPQATKVLDIINPMAGKYEVQVMGTGNGPYVLEVFNISNSVNKTRFSGSISTGEVVKYSVSIGYSDDIMTSSTEEELVLDFKLTPRTFNLPSNGVLTAHLTAMRGSIDEVDQSSIRLDGVTPTKISKDDNSLAIKFNREDFSGKTTGDVEFRLTGQTKDGADINLSDKIRVIDNGGQSQGKHNNGKGKKW